MLTFCKVYNGFSTYFECFHLPVVQRFTEIKSHEVSYAPYTPLGVILRNRQNWIEEIRKLSGNFGDDSDTCSLVGNCLETRTYTKPRQRVLVLKCQ